MINIDPVQYVTKKLLQIIMGFVATGVIFIILGIAIIFFPAIVQYLFVIGFILIGTVYIAIACKLKKIKQLVGKFELFGGKKIL